MRAIKTLDNGLKVMADPMSHMESVAIGMWIRAGGRYENKAISGISHLLEHLLFKGTVTRDMKTIKQEIEGRGGSFNGFTSEEHTCYLVKLLSKDAELGVDILSDMVLNPKLDRAEIEKEKNVIIEEINMYKDIPSHYVHELLAEMMWPGQPLGMPLAGTVESVKSITRDLIVAYKEAYYNPGNMLLIGAGHTDPDALVAQAGKYLSKDAGRKGPEYKKAVTDQDAPRLCLHTKDTEQIHMALGIHATDRFHPERHVLSILNIILGANMSSRLFHIVRDEMALCYEISSSIRRYEDCGAFVVGAGVDQKKLTRAIEVILKEMARTGREPVGKEELGRAKEYYKGQLLFALEDTMSRMLWTGEKVISGEKELDPAAILAKVDAVTSEDVMRVAGSIFKDASLNLALIGPVRKEADIKDSLHF
jgi:predicted Zn-dependent peptidase